MLGHVVSGSCLHFKEQGGCNTCSIKYKLGVVLASWRIASMALNWAKPGNLLKEI